MTERLATPTVMSSKRAVRCIVIKDIGRLLALREQVELMAIMAMAITERMMSGC